MLPLDLLARRIAITGDLRSIVRTMKTLSSVTIRQYETAVSALRDYTRTIELGLQVVLREAPPAAPIPARPGRRPVGPTVAVLFGSDHGLCGRFNEAVVELVETTLRDRGVATVDRLVLAVGLRLAARLEAADQVPDETAILPGSVVGLAATAEEILLTLDRWRTVKGAERVLLFHNRRTRLASAEPHVIQLLPLDPAHLHSLALQPWPSRCLPTFTMEASRLLPTLLRQRIFITVYRAIAESLASEHASRMVAMQAAERNIDERLEEMNAEFRRRRQEAITAELLDVVAGFETLRRGARTRASSHHRS